MSILINIFLVIMVIVELLLGLLVLMQRPKSEGLGTAFGSSMTGDLFGAQTTNVLQKATRWLAGMFFVLALLISMLTSKNARAGNQSVIQQQLSAAPAPKEMTADDIQKQLEQQAKEAHTGTAALPARTGTSPAASTTPASSGTTPESFDLHGGSLIKLGPDTGTSSNDEPQTPGIHLQTGTASQGLHLPTGGSPAPDQKTNHF